MFNPEDVNKAIDSLLKVVEASDDDCGNRLMVLPDGEYDGLVWETKHSSLVSQRAVATWLLAQREELKRISQEAR